MAHCAWPPQLRCSSSLAAPHAPSREKEMDPGNVFANPVLAEVFGK